MSKQPSNYWQLIRNSFLRKRRSRWAVRILIFLIGLAVLGDFVVGEIPIYCKIQNQIYFPAFKKQAIDWGLAAWSKPFQNVTWKELDYQQVIYPLIPYTYSAYDRKNNNYKSPFDTQQIDNWQFRHWLGTDQLGHDLAAGIMEGLQSALQVGVLSMLLASFIGIVLGGMAGYFGDTTFQRSLAFIVLNISAFVSSIYFGFIARSYALSEGPILLEFLKSAGITLLLFIVCNSLVKWLAQITFFSKPITIPIDLIVMRLIEVLNAIPLLLLILTLAGTIKATSIYGLIGIIGLLSWTSIARFIRSEILKIRSIEYIQAAKSLGFSEWHILFRHALPNALGPVLIIVAFGVAGTILLESALSFLGIGISSGQMTWGKLLAQSRSVPPNVWWITIFPGLAIFTMVFLFNIIGEGLKEAIDSRE